MPQNGATSKLQDLSIATDVGKSHPAPPSSQGRTLRPSDVLKLQNKTRSHFESPKSSNADPRPNPWNALCATTSESSERNPANYVIPQKRITQLRSVESAAITSAQHPSDLREAPSKSKSRREKVVGGLSKEDELQAIWAKFDAEERRQRFRPAAEAGVDKVSGNNVLGAWEEEHALYDLDQQEGPW